MKNISSKTKFITGLAGSRKMFILLLLLVPTFLVMVSWKKDKKEKPCLYIVGDSTVKNGKGTGGDGLWGWGNFIHEYFDTTAINIQNRALGGRSSRSFQTEGLWSKVLENMKPGDFVLIQFGHNDGGSLNTGRARGTLKGSGEQTEEVVLEASGKSEVVHTYGWYMRKYATDAQAKGAIPIILSQVPRNIWPDSGKVARASGDYGLWAKEAAAATGAFFIDLNEVVSLKYEELGQDKVKNDLFLKDHTHTTMEGAKINAACVVKGLSEIKECKLNNYVLKTGKVVQ